MSQKSLPAHRDYPDTEVSYDGPDFDYDAVAAESGDAPAPDTFPETLFDDEPVLTPAQGSRGHGDS